MRLVDIPLGAKIQIQTDMGTSFNTTIQDARRVGDVDQISILANAKSVALALHVIYVDDGCLRAWRCTRGKKIASGHLTFDTLLTNQEAKIINRREAYRVGSLQDLKYIETNGNNSGMVVDISMLGVGLRSRKPHNVGDVINFETSILDKRTVITSLINRTEYNLSERYPYTAGAIILGADKQLLNQFILNKQRQKLQRRSKQEII